MDVTVKETPLSVPEVALRTFDPVTGPSVHEPTVAVPEALVVVVAPETDPPPLTTAKVTVAPSIGDPFWSLTITEGDGVTTAPATPVTEVEEFAASVVATEGVVCSPLQLMKASRINVEASRVALTENLFTWTAGMSRAQNPFRRAIGRA